MITFFMGELSEKEPRADPRVARIALESPTFAVYTRSPTTRITIAHEPDLSRMMGLGKRSVAGWKFFSLKSFSALAKARLMASSGF
jgi:hypothetical protein